MITLLLTRHATTKANEEGLWIGHMESDLSSKGKKELVQLKEQLRSWGIDRCFASPSNRTVETASSIISEEVLIEKVEALREINFGSFEGKNYKWASEHAKEEVQKMLALGSAYCYPKGESLCMAHQRTAQWLNQFLASHDKGVYLICAHGGTIRSILSELLIKNESLHWHFKIDPASLTIVTIDRGFAVIEALNKRINSV